MFFEFLKQITVNGPENLKKVQAKNSRNKMNQFHGLFVGYFPFYESTIIFFVEKIQRKTS